MQRRTIWLFTGTVALIACAHAAPFPSIAYPPYEHDDSAPGRVVNVEAPEIPAAEATAASNQADTREILPAGVNPSDFDISIQYNERVHYFVDLFGKRHHDTFTLWLQRMSRFEPLIRQRLRANGLPGDLVYLALIESGFSPDAYSKAKAVGLWQLMEGTAKLQGLEVSTYVDERRDPLKSTDAAVRHLKGLHSVFGSWYLVAAAYNSGDGRVARTLKRETGVVKGDDSLFWKIDSFLPSETRNYVPQLIAAAILAKNPNLFGFKNAVFQRADSFDIVHVRRATDVAAIARAANVSVDEIRALNPHLYRGVTPPHRSFAVRVPMGTADGFADALAEIPARERVHNLTYIAQRGEKLSDIARRYTVSLASLKEANGIRKARPIRTARTLVIPLLADARMADASPKVKSTKSNTGRIANASSKKKSLSGETKVAGTTLRRRGLAALRKRG
jgi:membrane-bound lytic murein transglycosylase D